MVVVVMVVDGVVVMVVDGVVVVKMMCEAWRHQQSDLFLVFPREHVRLQLEEM
jgi:hypothetical protein